MSETTMTDLADLGAATAEAPVVTADDKPALENKLPFPNSTLP